MRAGARFAALVLLTFLLLAGCDGTGEIYIAYVDKVEPAIPGLSIAATRGIGGELLITNDTGQDVYIYGRDGSTEVVRITSTSNCREKNEQGEWTRCSAGNWWHYSTSIITYDGSRAGQAAGRYRGQVMKEWVVEGLAGDTPFRICGRTVYEPPR